MQESAVRRMASLEVIRHSINNLTDLVDSQMAVAGSEIKEGIADLFKGAVVLIIGLGGLVLMAIALMSAAVLAIALLSARVAFSLMGKGYRLIKGADGRLQGERTEEFSVDSASDAREIA